MVGAAINTGAKLDSASIHEILEVSKGRAGVTAAVTNLADAAAAVGQKPFSSPPRAGGGDRQRRLSALPLTGKFRKVYDVRVAHAWGMTETNRSAPSPQSQARDRQHDIKGPTDLQVKQGVTALQRQE